MRLFVPDQQEKLVSGVSVPLPGFSGLRLETTPGAFQQQEQVGFSPVAGIQWVETLTPCDRAIVECFSPVAGIQWVETPD